MQSELRLISYTCRQQTDKIGLFRNYISKMVDEGYQPLQIAE